MSTAVGPMPSHVGEVISTPTLPYSAPKSVDEQTRESLVRQSAWEQEAERRDATRQRLAHDLYLAEARATVSAAQLPIAEAHKKDLLSPKERNSEKWLMDGKGYERALRFAAQHIQNLEQDIRAPARIQSRLARLDSELEPDALQLVQCWNQATEQTRKMLLKMTGLEYVGNEEMHGIVNVSHPLPTTKR